MISNDNDDDDDDDDDLNDVFCERGLSRQAGTNGRPGNVHLGPRCTRVLHCKIHCLLHIVQITLHFAYCAKHTAFCKSGPEVHTVTLQYCNCNVALLQKSAYLCSANYAPWKNCNAVQ